MIINFYISYKLIDIARKYMKANLLTPLGNLSRDITYK